MSSGMAEGLKGYTSCALKNFDSDPNCSTCFSSCGEEFSRTKFCDCSIRIDVHDVCCLLMTVRMS